LCTVYFFLQTRTLGKITTDSHLRPFEYSALVAWHDQYGRQHLPWRHLTGLDDAARGYRVWLSEIFLQQTQADRVIGFYERVLERYPTIRSLAETTYEEFFPYYQGLGYYTRARNLLACAKIVQEQYGGVFPKEAEPLRKLPGIGPYTAEAIRAFAYDISTLSFDTNLEKVYARYYHGSRFLKLSAGEKSEILDQFSKTPYSAKLVNGALMDFASLYSKNSKSVIDHEASPFQDCLFGKTQGELEIETKKSAVYFPQKDARIEVILHENHRKYYSSSTEKYSPFYLEPTQDDIRKYVQDYFRTNYGLELSVRPAHLKEYRNDIPYLSMNAQIQAGTPVFPSYGKSEIR